MRINKFIASASGLSRRAADKAILDNIVEINGRSATLGDEVLPEDTVFLDGKALEAPITATTIMLNKPVGYVCSRDGQGSPMIYSLLPPDLQKLKSIGRLDKNSSGLILLTDDGDLANQLTHPSYSKDKVYEVTLDRELTDADRSNIANNGVKLEDGVSMLGLEKLDDTSGLSWQITMHEGRNHQIRRTFKALGYEVANLHRTKFGPYDLRDMASTQIFKIL